MSAPQVMLYGRTPVIRFSQDREKYRSSQETYNQTMQLKLVKRAAK